MLGLISFTAFGQNSELVTPKRDQVTGFPTWTDTNVTGSAYIQLLQATSSIVTPTLNLSSYESIKINFLARSFGGTNVTENTIYIAISNDNGNTWTDLASRVPSSSNLAAVTEISTVNNNTQVKIRFSVSGTNNSIGAGLDDIEIVGMKPNNLPPVVSPKAITGTYGVLLTNGTITATNNPTSWTQTGALPLGITFDNGVFSGTPTQAGSFIAQVNATNEFGTSASANVTFVIAKANQTVNYTFNNVSQNQGTTFSELPSQTDQGQNIVYSSADNSIVSINGNTLSFDGIGSTTVTATAIGGDNFNDYTTAFIVKSKDPNVVTYNGQGTFVKVNSLAEVTDGYYVITNEADLFLMTNNLSSSVLQSANANVVNGEIINPSTANVWKIETDGASKTIYNEVVDKYVGWMSGNSAALSSSLSNNYRWSFTYASNKFTVNNVATPLRQLSYNAAAPRFASYEGAGQQELQFYKLIPSPSTTWDGTTWSNGEPDLTKDAIVKGEVVIDSKLEAKTLTISDAGGSILLKSGGCLTVDGTIDNQAGLTGLIIENGANLIQNQNVTNTGAITVKRKSNSMVRNDMTFWSSPVDGQVIRSFSQETLYNRFWTYNETADEFSQILTSDTDSKLFEAGVGVAIRVKNTLPTGQNTIHNGEFLGVPFNGNIEVPVQFTTNGYNQVGNPYASNINVEKFLLANEHVNSLYFWSHQFPVGSPEYANNYIAFNVVGGVIPNLSNISVGQGFIVGLSQATPTVNFNNAMRTSQDALFYKNSNVEKNRIWLSLSKENKTISQILLAYMDGATNGLDNQIDAKVMQRGSSAIYSLINDEAYAIQGRSLPFKTEDAVKLGVEVLEQGNYTINIEQLDGLFEKGQIIYLKDKELNKIHNLSESVYSFASKEGVFNDRFELIYSEKTLATNELTKNDITIYNSNNSIVIKSNNSNIVSIQLFDIQGKKVMEKNSINSQSFNLESKEKGVLVIKVSTEDGKIKTQKIVNK